MKIIQHIAAVAMISIFSAALYFTFSDWVAFEVRLMKAPFIPVWLIPVIQWLVPAIEILLIGWLLHPNTYRKAWLVGTVLHASIGLYLILILRSSFGPPCGCSGIFPSLSITQHLFLQLFLFVLSLILYVMHPSSKPLSPFRLHSDSQVS